jgi:hypothetical protein
MHVAPFEAVFDSVVIFIPYRSGDTFWEYSAIGAVYLFGGGRFSNEFALMRRGDCVRACCRAAGYDRCR